MSDLLADLGVKKEGIAVEVNRQIVLKAKHAETRIQAGDAIEIVTFVGGG